MAMFLESTFGLEHQAREIADASWVTLLVEIDGALAGYAQVKQGPPPPCVVGPSPIELYRFYVDTAWKGRGVAQRLMSEVRATAVELGGQTLWLGVWEHNPRAKAFYAKCGFSDVGSHDFALGTDTQTDRIFVASLVE
jgi:ribosomal protein S18 acetylase RimI-like enzyme